MTVEEIFSRVLRVPADKVTDDATPATLKRWDSFTHIRLIVAIEDGFKVKFEPGEIEKMKSVALVKEALRKHGAG